jgi:hypothetical protein
MYGTAGVANYICTSKESKLEILFQRWSEPVLRIHDILGWIRGSMSLTNGSGSGSWIRILLFWSFDLQDASKKLIFNTIFSAYYFLKVHLHHFSKIKSQKESQNIRNQGSYYIFMMIEGSGSGSIPLTSGSGSGSGRPKNMWIRIRIRNTGRSCRVLIQSLIQTGRNPLSFLCQKIFPNFHISLYIED